MFGLRSLQMLTRNLLSATAILLNSSLGTRSGICSSALRRTVPAQLVSHGCPDREISWLLWQQFLFNETPQDCHIVEVRSEGWPDCPLLWPAVFRCGGIRRPDTVCIKSNTTSAACVCVSVRACACVWRPLYTYLCRVSYSESCLLVAAFLKQFLILPSKIITENLVLRHTHAQ
jgi:hypothetical protein